MDTVHSTAKVKSPMEQKSSFMQRKISKEDTIIQILRPNLGGRIATALDVFDRMVSECETLTNLGIEVRTGHGQGEKHFITPTDLKENLDEYGELLQLALKGRELLAAMGYVSPRRAMPITGEGTAPVGKDVNVLPITTKLPGSEPLSGVVLTPKKSKA